MSFVRRLAAAAMLCAGFAAGGCGSDQKYAEISGNVTFDGKPIEKGRIAFYPIDGKGTPEGAAIVDGAYKSKVSFGDMKVTINATKIIGTRKLYKNDPKSPVIDIPQEIIPDRYHNRSELSVTVKDRVSEKDFDLKKDFDVKK